MAETNAPPTKAETLLIRADLEDFLAEGRTVESHITDALAECKRILEDERGVVWETVFDTTNDAYFDNSDSTGRNEDRIQNAISHMAASFIFRDYSVKFEENDNWSALADYHYDMAVKRLLKSKLDVDTNESGAIDASEESQLGQTFMVR